MAKKRRHNKKRHQDQSHPKEEFLADVPEKEEETWSDDQEDQKVVEEPQEEISRHAEQESTESPYEPFQESDEPDPDENLIEATFTLGTFLKNERESRNIALKSVGQSTKISLTNLEFLEDDDLHSLPDRAYVIGYVKSYARLLGVDINFCLDLLNKTYESLGESKKEPEIVLPQAQNSPQMDDQAHVAKIIAVVVMIVILIGIGWFLLNREPSSDKEPVAQEPVEEVEEKTIQPQTLNAETPLQEDLPSDEAIGASVDEDETSAEEEMEPEVEDTPPKKEEVKKIEAKKEEPETKPETKEEDKETADKKESEEEKKKFYAMVTPLYSMDNSMSQEDIDKLLPDSFKVSPQEGIQAVYITAVNGDSWLTYKSDNDPIKKFVLRKGRSLLFRAKEARVFLGNLGAVKVFLNNKPLKITSPSGVKSLVFPQENADKYVTPLFIYEGNGNVQTSKEWIDENQPN